MITTGIAEHNNNDGILMTLVKGALIGIANIIPGVSGGTFALILGIFERLVGALNNIGSSTIKTFISALSGGFRGKKGRAFTEELRRIDASFLIILAIGAFAAILSTSFLIDFLLREHHSPTLAFFIGLILPSIVIPWSMLEKRGIVLLWAVPGIVLTVGVSFIMPETAAGSDNLLIAIIIGAIAVSAMILPGLSGSYVMLVMGQYQNVLTKLTQIQRAIANGQLETDAIIWLGALFIGIIAGIILFARFLNFLLKQFHSATMMFLIGLLIGSLWILWPFKDIDAGADIKNKRGEIKQEVKIATAPNRLPNSGKEALPPILLFSAGFACSAGIIAAGKRLDKGNNPL